MTESSSVWHQAAGNSLGAVGFEGGASADQGNMEVQFKALGSFSSSCWWPSLSNRDSSCPQKAMLNTLSERVPLFHVCTATVHGRTYSPRILQLNRHLALPRQQRNQLLLLRWGKKSKLCWRIGSNSSHSKNPQLLFHYFERALWAMR